MQEHPLKGVKYRNCMFGHRIVTQSEAIYLASARGKSHTSTRLGWLCWQHWQAVNQAIEAGAKQHATKEVVA